MEDYNEQAQPQAEEVIVQESAPVTQEVVNTETPEQKSFRVKHLHEEKEISYDDAPIYIQKGLDYDRVKDKYESSKPVLSFVEELAKENGMDVQTYLKAVEDYKAQEYINALVQQNIPEEYAKEILENRKWRQELEQEKTTKAKQSQEQTQYQEFFNHFESENGRNFDTVKDEIPKEVWELVGKGKTLVDAYQLNERNILKARIKEMEGKQAINQTNTNLAQTGTGSVTGLGNNHMDVLTEDYIDNHMTDKEMAKRWAEVKKIKKMK